MPQVLGGFMKKKKVGVGVTAKRTKERLEHDQKNNPNGNRPKRSFRGERHQLKGDTRYTTLQTRAQRRQQSPVMKTGEGVATASRSKYIKILESHHSCNKHKNNRGTVCKEKKNTHTCHYQVNKGTAHGRFQIEFSTNSDVIFSANSDLIFSTKNNIGRSQPFRDCNFNHFETAVTAPLRGVHDTVRRRQSGTSCNTLLEDL